jgi:RNA polymerase sigma factor (sigma-70 family)
MADLVTQRPSSADTPSWDRCAFTDFYETEAPAILRYVHRQVMSRGGWPTAQDITQRAFEIVWADWPHWETLHPRVDPRRWLRGIVKNLIQKEWERGWRESSTEAQLAGLDDKVEMSEIDPALREQTVTAIRELPPAQAAAIALTIDGYTADDIAAILSMNPATVRSNLRHARKRLRIKLWDPDDPHASLTR